MYTQPEMKNLILFDIDDTMINTILYRKIQDETLAKYLQISDDEVKQDRSDYYFGLEKGSDFSIDEYLSLLAKKYGHTLEELKSIFFNEKNIELCLYEDVIPVLEKLKKSGFTLGIFSEGYEYFQKFKLEKNNLINFFDKKYTFILRRKMDQEVLSNLPEGTTIIDDKPVNLEQLKQFDNLNPIQIIRENKKHEPVICKKHISNLEELIDLL